MSLCPEATWPPPILGGGGNAASEPELGKLGNVDGLGGTKG